MWSVRRLVAAERLPSDAEPSDGLGESGRVLEVPAVRLPSIGGPDLRVIARADDDRVRRQTGHLPEIPGEQDAALGVERRLDGASEDESLEPPGPLVRNRQGRHLVREGVPADPG